DGRAAVPQQKVDGSSAAFAPAGAGFPTPFEAGPRHARVLVRVGGKGGRRIERAIAAADVNVQRPAGGYHVGDAVAGEVADRDVRGSVARGAEQVRVVEGPASPVAQERDTVAVVLAHSNCVELPIAVEVAHCQVVELVSRPP